MGGVMWGTYVGGGGVGGGGGLTAGDTSQEVRERRNREGGRMIRPLGEQGFWGLVHVLLGLKLTLCINYSDSCGALCEYRNITNGLYFMVLPA